MPSDSDSRSGGRGDNATSADQRTTAGEANGASAAEFHDKGVHVHEVVTIRRAPHEVYEFWRNFENLPRFMKHLERVVARDHRRSRWTAKAPAGTTVSWDAEVINEQPGRLIAWRSLGDADVDNRGSVRFREHPAGRGTEVHVTLEYIPPAGKVGSALAKLLGEEPKLQVRDDLRRLRALLETGEIPTIKGQPSGRKQSQKEQQAALASNQRARGAGIEVEDDPSGVQSLRQSDQGTPSARSSPGRQGAGRSGMGQSEEMS